MTFGRSMEWKPSIIIHKDKIKIEPLTQVEKEILEKARAAIANHVLVKSAEEEIDRIQLLMLRDYLIKNHV